MRGSPRGAARAALTAAPRSSRGASVVASTLERVRVRDGSVAVRVVSPYGSSTFTHRILPSSGTLDKHSRSAESSGGGELLARDRHRAMKPPEVIETDRLRLRRPVMEDAAAIFSTYAQDPEVARFVSWSVHPSVDVTRKFVEEDCVAGWKTGQVFPWLITLAAGGEGGGVIVHRPVGARARSGYGPSPRHWGGGLMPEGARPRGAG